MATDSVNNHSLGEEIFQDLNNINEIGEFNMKDDLNELFSSLERTNATRARNAKDNMSDVSSETPSSYSSGSSNSKSSKKTRKYERINTNGLSDGQVGEIRRQRKRQQNRVSSLKCRQKKKNYVSRLEDKTQGVVYENNRLCMENATLKTENDILRGQLQYFQDLVVNIKKDPVSKTSAVGSDLTNTSGSEAIDKQGPQANYNPRNDFNGTLNDQVEDFFLDTTPAGGDQHRLEDGDDFIDLLNDDANDLQVSFNGNSSVGRRPIFMMGVIMCAMMAFVGFSGDDSNADFAEHFGSRGGTQLLFNESNNGGNSTDSMKIWALPLLLVLSIACFATAAFGKSPEQKKSVRYPKTAKGSAVAKTTKVE